MTWLLCDGSSEFLTDMWGGQPDDSTWQSAKKHFRDKGYFGKWLLIANYRNSFKPYNIDIRPKDPEDLKNK